MASPRAEFGVRPRLPRVGEAVRITDASSDPDGCGIASRAWDFGDGTTTAAEAPTHAYLESGCYVITLTLRTPDGATATARHTVLVAD